MKPIVSLLNFATCLALSTAAVVPSLHAHQNKWRYDGLQFSGPVPGAILNCITVGTGGVYVGESFDGGWRILQFTEGGVFLRRFDTPLGDICGLACDPVGNVYALDPTDSQIKVFGKDGVFLRQFGAAGSGDGQINPGPGSKKLALDKDNRIFIADSGNGRIVIFNNNGDFSAKWGQTGSLPSQFIQGAPYQVAITLDGRVISQSGSQGWMVSDLNGVFQRVQPNNGNSLIVMPDGLLLNGNRSFPLLTDENGVSVGEFPAYGGGEIAASNRGDVFNIIYPARILVYEREYTNVQNSLLPPAIPQPQVLATGQRSGKSWLDIDYQVTDVDSPTVTTGVLVFRNGSSLLNDAVVPTTFLEGTGSNVGAAQPTGVSRHLTWHMAADWSVDFAQIQVEVLAKDSRNLLGIHYITVPASGGDPAIQVSASPIRNRELYDIWLWLLATHQPGIALNAGRIMGTAGAYDNELLLENNNIDNIYTENSPSIKGLEYLYALLNVRAITPDEITRANAGTYGFDSLFGTPAPVDARFVVKLP